MLREACEKRFGRANVVGRMDMWLGRNRRMNLLQLRLDDRFVVDLVRVL